MHECPECGQVCYCDLDDSNDCRDDGECFHGCEPEDDEPDYFDDDGPVYRGDTNWRPFGGASGPAPREGERASAKEDTKP